MRHLRFYFAGPALLTAVAIAVLGPLIVKNLWSNMQEKVGGSAEELPVLSQWLIAQPLAITILAIPAVVLGLIAMKSRRFGVIAGIAGTVWAVVLFAVVMFFFVSVLGPAYQYQEL